MQFQVQQVVTKDKLTQKDQDNLDLFVGLKSPLNSPYNIFLRLKDIENNSDIIYFYGYSMGKERVIIWGLYDKTNSEFLIDNSCQYNPNDLMIIINTWKENKYDYFFNAMKDRMSDRINQYKVYDNKNEIAKLSEQFKKVYIQNLVNNGLLSGKHTDIGDYDQTLNNVYRTALKLVDKNGLIIYKLNTTLNLLLNELDTKEDEIKIRDIILQNKWKGTEYQLNVAKHILIHLFLVTFLTMDDYRAAKYINYINSGNKTNDKLMKYLKGSFFYEWLMELGKVLRVYKLNNFMKDISEDTLRLANVNMTSMPATVIDEDMMSNIATAFEDFISKSKYSKVSYAKELDMCPSIKSCDHDQDNCDLYTHGHTTYSKYDQT